MLLAAKALLDHNPHPTREQIREAISGNLCRCTGYQKIVDAVEAVAKGAYR
jgi:carbon-monoxide dehydrogenase small subunit